MTIELFVPFIRNDSPSLIRDRRLRISIDDTGTGNCILEEQINIRGIWYSNRDNYDTLGFPIEIVPELAEALQRLIKLLILK